MPKGKKTKVIFVFERHLPGSAKKAMEISKDADILLLELEPKIVEKTISEIKKGRDIESVLKTHLGLSPTYGIKFFRIKEMLERGAQIYGIDSAEEIWEKYGSPRNPEAIIERDKRMVKEILNHIKKNPGKKIAVQLGAMHIGVYIRLKRLLKKEGLKDNVSIQIRYTTKGEIPRYNIIFHPLDVYTRRLLFNKMGWDKNYEWDKNYGLLMAAEKWFNREFERIYRKNVSRYPDLDQEELYEKSEKEAIRHYWSLWNFYLKNKEDFWKEVSKKTKRMDLIEATEVTARELIKKWEKSKDKS